MAELWRRVSKVSGWTRVGLMSGRASERLGDSWPDPGEATCVKPVRPSEEQREFGGELRSMELKGERFAWQRLTTLSAHSGSG